MWHLQRGSKYGNYEKEYNGQIYHSKKEAGWARELDLLIRAKKIKSYERQVRFSIDVNGYHICNYIADFVVTDNLDEKIIEEVKGFETDVFRLKWKLMEALYGKKYKLVLIK